MIFYWYLPVNDTYLGDPLHNHKKYEDYHNMDSTCQFDYSCSSQNFSYADDYINIVFRKKKIKQI